MKTRVESIAVTFSFSRALLLMTNSREKCQPENAVDFYYTVQGKDILLWTYRSGVYKPEKIMAMCASHVTSNWKLFIP